MGVATVLITLSLSLVRKLAARAVFNEPAVSVPRANRQRAAGTSG